MRYLVFLAPVALSALAAAVLRFGWPRATGWRRPTLFRSGLVLIAAGLTGLWVPPVCLSAAMSGWGAEPRGLVYLLTAFAAFGLIGGGLDAIRRSNNTPADDFWDSL